MNELYQYFACIDGKNIVNIDKPIFETSGGCSIYPNYSSHRIFWDMSHLDEYFNLCIMKWLALQSGQVKLSLAPTKPKVTLGEFSDADLTQCELVKLSTAFQAMLSEMHEWNLSSQYQTRLEQLKKHQEINREHETYQPIHVAANYEAFERSCDLEEEIKSQIWRGFLINHDRKEVLDLNRYHQLVSMEGYGPLIYNPLPLLFGNRDSFKQSSSSTNEELGRWEMDNIEWISREEAEETGIHLDAVNNEEWLQIDMWLAATFRYAHIK